jgi:hypothetical protein
MSRDLHHNVSATAALDTVTFTTSGSTVAVGNLVDLAGYNAVELVFLSGALTTGNFAVSLDEGDNATLGDATPVDMTALLGTLPTFSASEDNTAKRVGYCGSKRFVRPTVTSSAGAAGTVSAVAILGSPLSAPVA